MSETNEETTRLAALVNAPARLAAVERARLLDTPAEEAFDALTRMAAALLRVPASFVSVVDRDRDFYKSQAGFPDALADARQLVGVTFCHHTLSSSGPLVISDTHAEPGWRAVPTVDSLGVRAYVGVPLRLDGETIGSFCVTDTVPRAWSVEEVAILEQLALSAERELTLRAALRDAREEASRSQALVRATEEIVAVISHDLRTPLQVLHLSASALRLSCTPEQAAITTRMLAATEAMQRMADDLLADHAPQVIANSRPRPIDAAALLADVADTMSLIATRAGVTVAVARADHADLSIDYAQVLRVFCNLLGNAIKFSDRGSTVTLTAVRDGAQVHLTVADRGRGMTELEQRRAFVRGFQGAEGLSSGEGVGLGLPIVKTLVERNGGSVRLDSAAGQGTTVIITLPCS